MERRLVIGLLVLVFTALLLCFFYVKPGVSRYTYSQCEHYSFRVDRLTGEKTVWLENGEEFGRFTSLTGHWHRSANCPNCEKKW